MYYFETESNLQKFLRYTTTTLNLMSGILRSITLVCNFMSEYLTHFFRLPEKYWDLKLPHKLPPLKSTMPVTDLPMLGYMEQTVSKAITTALTAVGNFKPKYPFLSTSRSSLLYVAYHLKGMLNVGGQPSKTANN